MKEIKSILVREMNVPERITSSYMKLSRARQVFEINIEVAAHTSYRTWAQRVYSFAQSARGESRLGRFRSAIRALRPGSLSWSDASMRSRFVRRKRTD